VSYDDGTVACTDDELVIGRYYFPRGARRIPYRLIKQVRAVPLESMGWRIRIWGSRDLVHWWNLDLHRSDKPVALIVDTGGRMRAVITPEDADSVTAELFTHGVHIVRLQKGLERVARDLVHPQDLHGHADPQ
jgi:hypothetical protein